HLICVILVRYFFYSAATPPNLHSFPTRRSSDLTVPPAGGKPHVVVPYVHDLSYNNPTFLDEEHIAITRVAVGADPELLVVSGRQDRKSTRLNSSHVAISYAVFCLKKKRKTRRL